MGCADHYTNESHSSILFLILASTITREHVYSNQNRIRCLNIQGCFGVISSFAKHPFPFCCSLWHQYTPSPQHSLGNMSQGLTLTRGVLVPFTRCGGVGLLSHLSVVLLNNVAVYLRHPFTFRFSDVFRYSRRPNIIVVRSASTTIQAGLMLYS